MYPVHVACMPCRWRLFLRRTLQEAFTHCEVVFGARSRPSPLRLVFLVQDGLKTGSELLDCGCGVGGPMRNIARFTGSNVTGITINHYQVRQLLSFIFSPKLFNLSCMRIHRGIL